MPMWHPMAWAKTSSNDRIAELAQWERDTLQPKYGINLGGGVTQTIGVAQLDDYDRYFIHFPANVHDWQLAQALGIEVGAEVEYYPRRAYNLWNTRYFIVPFFRQRLARRTRASASFVSPECLVYPPADRFIGPKANEEADKWIDTRDFRVLRNLQEYPRAWVVHRARPESPPHPQSRCAVSETLQENPLTRTTESGLTRPGEFTTREMSPGWLKKTSRKCPAFISPDRREVLQRRLPSPTRARNRLFSRSPSGRPGSYPGRRLLSGLAIGDRWPAGPGVPYERPDARRGRPCRLARIDFVYTYTPWSFRIGLVVSIAGLAGLLALGLFCVKLPADPVLACVSKPDGVPND